jgi:hypothetical protein
MERRTGQLIAAAVGVTAVAAVAVVLLVSRDETQAGRGETASSPDVVTTSSTVASSDPRSTSPSLTPLTSAQSSSEFRLGFEGLGPVRFGMTLAQAQQALGRTVTAIPGTSCATIAGMPETWLGVGSDDRVLFVVTQSAQVRTDAGVHVDSLMEDVQRAYPAAQRQRGVNTTMPLVAKDAQGGGQLRFFPRLNGQNVEPPGSSVVAITVVPGAAASIDATCT